MDDGAQEDNGSEWHRIEIRGRSWEKPSSSSGPTEAEEEDTLTTIHTFKQAIGSRGFKIEAGLVRTQISAFASKSCFRYLFMHLRNRKSH